MKKIIVFVGLCLFPYVCVSAVGPSIGRVWIEEKKVDNSSYKSIGTADNPISEKEEGVDYNLWIEVFDESGSLAQNTNDVFVTIEEKESIFDGWSTPNRLGLDCYRSPYGKTDCSKKYYGIGMGFPRSDFEEYGYRYEIRIRAVQNGQEDYKEATFYLGNYPKNAPDLMIKSVEVSPRLEVGWDDFLDPVLDVLVEVQNVGNEEAVMKSGERYLDVSLKINNTKKSFYPAPKFYPYKLNPGESTIFDFSLKHDKIEDLMKDGENSFWFRVDVPSDGYERGIVTESDEFNNSYTYKYVTSACVDSEKGNDHRKAGTINIYGLDIPDKCDETGLELREYACYNGYFRIYERLDKCSNCVEGECIDGAECFDTDGYKDIYKQGGMQGYENENRNSRFNYDDECLSDSILREYYCEGFYGDFEEYICPNGCEYSACVEDDLSMRNVCGDGCEIDGGCVVIGERVVQDDKIFYCHKDQLMHKLKDDFSFCKSDTECLSGICSNAVCGVSCYGCKDSGDSCIPIGTRTTNKFCDVTRKMNVQKGNDLVCNNSFECRTNFCLEGRCVESKFFQRILDWFQGLWDK